MGRIYRFSEEWDERERRPIGICEIEVGKLIDGKTGKELSPEERSRAIEQIRKKTEEWLNSPENAESIQRDVELFEEKMPYILKIQPFVESSGLQAYLNKIIIGVGPEEVAYTHFHIDIADYLVATDGRQRGEAKTSIRRKCGKDRELLGLAYGTLELVDEYRKTVGAR